MGTKTRLGSYCTKRANNGVNLVTSRNINTRLARPITTSGHPNGLESVESVTTRVSQIFCQDDLERDSTTVQGFKQIKFLNFKKKTLHKPR